MIKKKCYHCNSNVKDFKHKIIIENKDYYMCCSACLAVYSLIKESGLLDYYKNREYPGEIVNLENNNKNYKKKKKNFAILQIDGIKCAACAWLIEKHLKKNINIKELSINTFTSRASILWNSNKLSLNEIFLEFKKIGYKACIYNIKKKEKQYQIKYKNSLKNIIIAGLGAMQVMTLSLNLYTADFFDINFNYWCFMRWISFIITTPILFFAGKSIIKNGLKSLIKKNLNLNVTISLSLLLTYISSINNLIYNKGHIYFDSICMFIFFILIVNFLELRVKYHSFEIINTLNDLTPKTTRIILKNKEKTILTSRVKKNMLIMVKPGEIIPLDGIVINGCSNIDESMITGEFNPIYKTTGNSVIGGTINLENYIIIKVTNEKNKSKLNYIIKLLKKSETLKIFDNKFIDIVSKYFTLFSFFIIIFFIIIWINIDYKTIPNIILSMLAITCPCALSLSIPIASVTSISLLAKKGFLIAKKNIFNNLSKSKEIVFDKTGTLTLNKISIKNIKFYRNVNLKKIISLSKNLEIKSNHPISKAFQDVKKKYEYSILSLNMNIINHISKGIQFYSNKKIYKIGKYSFIKNCFLKKNISYIFLSNQKSLLAHFNLTNPLRNKTNNTIKKLKTLNFKIHIITGDSYKNTKIISKKLKIKDILTNCSIKKKIKYILNIKKKNNVIMVGDGINDALALKKANVSISMGSGTDITKLNSDAILLNNNLLNIYFAIIQSIKTEKIIKQNIYFSIMYNFIGIFIAGMNLINPYYAAIGMSISSILVVLNSLRLGK